MGGNTTVSCPKTACMVMASMYLQTVKYTMANLIRILNKALAYIYGLILKAKSKNTKVIGTRENSMG